MKAGGTLTAGQLRHRVTLQTRTDAQDDFGEAVPTWGDLATVWGLVEPLTGREREQAEGLESTVDHRITIRHRADLDARARAQYNGRTFEFVAVYPDEVNARTTIMAVEKVD